MEDSMVQYIAEYNAPPELERWSTVTKEEIAERLADMKDSLIKTTDSISIASFNSEIEDAEAALKASEQGDTVWFAEDEDGGYYAVGEIWRELVQK